MFLFNSHEGGLAGRNLKSSGDEASASMLKKRLLFTALTGEENPRFMAGLLLTLVLLLHIGAVVWLLKPDEQPKTPSLVIMEVSLVSAPTQKAEITPPTPPKPEPPKPEPPKKQPVKKKAPVVPKQAELPKPQAVAEEKPAPSIPAPAPSVSAPQPVSRPAAAPTVVKSEPRISTGVVPLERVPPKYPARAASRHIEGWVKIEFTITTNGEVENAVVVESDPPEIFDDAALKAINQWTFKEKTVNGVAVEQRAVQTLQFKLTQ
jgi:protein TonB